MPPVSMRVQGRDVREQGAEIRSRVTPGWSWTMEILRPARRLKSADFPTLGRPTMATVGISSQFQFSTLKEELCRMLDVWTHSSDKEKPRRVAFVGRMAG
jgi:hypothetical protein